MAGSLPISHDLADLWRVSQPVLDLLGDGAFADRRRAAWDAFQAVGLPTSRDEEFKFLNLHPLTEATFAPAYGANVDRSEIVRLPLGQLDAITVTLVNGQIAPELGTIDALPEGVFIGPYDQLDERAQAEVLDQVGSISRLAGKLGSTNDERFDHLNLAFLSELIVVRIPANVTLQRPIHVQSLSFGNGPAALIATRLWVELGENAEATLVESYSGLGGPMVTIPAAEYRLGRDARLNHVRYQDEHADAVQFSVNALHQESGSVVTTTNVNFGGRLVRHDINVWLNGEHTETWLNGVNVATSEQTMDNHTRIDHAKPNCNSFEVYKSILRDRAHGVFNGKIFVYEDAQKTDAKQTNQALLLSGTAQMNTKPQLEIFADDVKCTHGATIGQLQADAMFYLRARGVPKAEAEALLVFAFANDVIAKISVEAVRDALETRLFQKLNP
ncbi:MAG: Fe-S cluster assembly protein SufD [Fimbriimonadaceae bacterium]|nr:Fe-S cluster assembly protein SufD [Fimbriimonadaceae bacterium]